MNSVKKCIDGYNTYSNASNYINDHVYHKVFDHVWNTVRIPVANVVGRNRNRITLDILDEIT